MGDIQSDRAAEPFLTFRSFRFGSSDPTSRIVGDTLHMATHTTLGPATVRIGPQGQPLPSGPGATAIAKRPFDLRGDTDTYTNLEEQCPSSVDSVHFSVVQALEKRWGHVRIGATGDVYRAALTATLGQRITAAEAVAQWRRLCVAFGHLCDTSRDTDSLSLHSPPDPEVLARASPFQLHRFGIEESRARTLIAIAQVFLRPGSHHHDHEAAMARLCRDVPRFGPWTQALVRYEALGDPDAVAVGDFHLKNVVTYAFTGNPRGTDDAMIDLLDPYRGQRGRILMWLGLAGIQAPKFGPRRRNVDFRRM